MKRNSRSGGWELWSASIAAVLWSATSAAALTFEFNNPFPGMVSPAGTAPWLTVDLTDNGNSVQMTVTANLGSQKLDKLYLNFDDGKDVDGLGLTVPSGPVPTFTADQNNLQADSDGKFDLVLDWLVGDRPTGTQSFTYQFDYFDFGSLSFANIDPSDFDFFSAPAGSNGPFQAAAFIEELPQTQGAETTWIYANTRTPPPQGVPDAANTLTLLGLAFVGLWSARSLLSARPTR